MDNNDGIPLADVLEYISAQLREAERRAEPHGPTMRFAECELEFALDVEGKAGGGLQVYVMKLEGGVKRTEKNTIKIKYVALPDEPMEAQVTAEVPQAERIPREGKKG